MRPGLTFALLTPALLALCGVTAEAATVRRPQRLADATPAQVRARLGEPAIATGEGKGALWTYRREACALMVFFTDDGRGLRVSAVTAAPRRWGEAAPELADCLDSKPRF